ncbi:50S ribosomal protein L30 [Candidatus Nitrospira inopinata]|jgi:large subunit ribosomal protein L30|uniref:50S ribosomal protein L30 n=1 Tax=Candidatus Nitrospira inopinata TaxID=1715989 RepID=A0A0S4KWD4_9BACT|nr:50S ribosomal protein L30 [Candidatus Nitrospira inopinata]
MGTEEATRTRSSNEQALRVTLRRSPIGTPDGHRRVLRGLGLRRIRQTVIHPDTPQVRGMIRKVWYLLEVGKP